MEDQYYLIICVAVPLLGSLLLPLLGRISVVLRNMAALLFVLTAFFCSAMILPTVLSGSSVLLRYELPLGLTFGLLGDSLAVYMALTSSLVAAIIVFYSFGYIERYDNQNEYYMMVVMFIGAMMGLVYTTSLIYMYIFWEISAICCWRLIGFYRQKDIVRRADKAFLVTMGGATLMLIGFVAIYIQSGTFDLTALQGSGVDNWIVVLILFGILAKSATLPLHTWLPDAGVAPSPATSLLHAAVLVKIGVYAFARLFLINFQLEAVWTVAIPIIAAVSALVAAGAAIAENDMKRIVAYSTISQLAFILLGLSCGNMNGAAGGLLYILMHSLAKGGLFLCAGIIEHQTHTKDIRLMGGLYRRLPITCVTFAMCAFSVMGLPPFGGFFAKYLVIDGALQTGQPWLAIVFVLGAVMTVVYLSRLFIKVFFGPCTHPDLREGSWEMVTSVGLLAIVSVLAGVFINIPANFVNLIVSAMGRW